MFSLRVKGNEMVLLFQQQQTQETRTLQASGEHSTESN